MLNLPHKWKSEGSENYKPVKEISVEEYLATCEKVMTETIKINKKVHFVFPQILPSIENDKNCKSRYKETNKRLRKIIEEQFDTFASVLSIARHFTYYGQIRKEYYQDKVHMNRAGAEEYARLLELHLSSLDKKKYAIFH